MTVGVTSPPNGPTSARLVTHYNNNNKVNLYMAPKSKKSLGATGRRNNICKKLIGKLTYD